MGGMMSVLDKAIGKVFHARDGMMDVPFHKEAPHLQASASNTGKTMEVRGTAYSYNTVGYFPWLGALLIRPGAITADNRPGRDVQALFGHDHNRILARISNQTLNVEFLDDRIDYAMRLNENDTEAQSAWAKVVRGDVNASSMGFYVIDAEMDTYVDNSLDGDGEEIEVIAATEVQLIEISLVPQGAFAGASSYTGGIDLSAPKWLYKDKDKEEGNLEEDDEESEDYNESENPPTDASSGNTGDESESSGEDKESEEEIPELESKAEEDHGITIKESIRRLRSRGIKVNI